MKKKLVIFSLTSLLAITPVASGFAADTTQTTDQTTTTTTTNTAADTTMTGSESGTVNSGVTTGTMDDDNQDEDSDEDSDDNDDENSDQNHDENDDSNELDEQTNEVIGQFMDKLMEAVQTENGELNQEKLQEALKEMLQHMKQNGKANKADSEKEAKEMVKQKLQMEIQSGTATEQNVEFLVTLKLEDDEDDDALKAVETALEDQSDSDKLYDLLSKVYQKKGDTEKVKVYVGGKQPNFDVTPFIENGRTMIPIRAVSEALGANVTWNGETQTVVISKDGITIELPIGSNAIKVNGVEQVIDVPASITDNRTVVPIRFISEFLGHQVDFDQTTHLVIVK